MLIEKIQNTIETCHKIREVSSEIKECVDK